MEPLILQEIHRHTAVLVEALNEAAAAASSSLQLLSMHPTLRRPLRRLDRSLGRWQALLNEQQQLHDTNNHPMLLSLGNEGHDDPSLVLGGGMQGLSQGSTFAESWTQHHEQQQLEENLSLENLYERASRDLWTILIRLPATEDAVCVSILRRTAQLWFHLTTATSLMIPSFANFETLWQLIAQTPDCLFATQGLVWVRIANQLRAAVTTQDAPLASSRLAYHTLRAVLPVVSKELQCLVDTTATTGTTTVRTAADQQRQETSRFVRALVHFLAAVLQDLVTSQTTATQVSWEDWWALVTESPRPQAEIVHWMNQLVDYATLLVDYAQDELDQACAAAASDAASVSSSSSSSLVSSSFPDAIDTMFVVFISVHCLHAWQEHYPALDCTSRLHTLWTTLANANVAPGTPATIAVHYETCYLPVLVQMTQHILTLGAVDVTTFIGVWLRFIPYGHAWGKAEEIWVFLEQQQQQAQDDEASEWPALRRLIQLVLMTISPATNPGTPSEQVDVCLRLQKILQNDKDILPKTNMAEMYFANNYQSITE